jgi:hypothetical protein
MVGEVAGSSSLPEALVSYLKETPISAHVVVFMQTLSCLQFSATIYTEKEAFHVSRGFIVQACGLSPKGAFYWN